MKYNFEQALQRIEILREKANKGNYMPALRMLTTYLEEAAVQHNHDKLIVGLVQRAILRMHQHERALESNRTYLALYYADIHTALELAGQLSLREQFRECSRKMGDYFHEIENYKEALNYYQYAVSALPLDNSRAIAEYLGPFARAQVLSNGNLKSGLFNLTLAKKSAEACKKELPAWHWMIVKSGVDMKYAEALYHLGKGPKAHKLMIGAKAVAEELNRKGYRQRLIQWRRLVRKLELSNV
jgi:hypothetical protein